MTLHLIFWQALTFRKFPSVLIIVSYQSFFTAIMSTLFSLILVKDPSAWKLRLDMGLLAILYSVSNKHIANSSFFFLFFFYFNILES